MRALLITAVLLALAGLAGAIWGHQMVQRHADRALNVTTPEVLIVEPGSTVNGVIAELRARGMLDDQPWHDWLIRLQPELARIQAGEFEIAPRDSLRGVLQKLVDGEVVQRAWTIVPGLRLAEVLRSLDGLPLERTEGLNDQTLASQLGLEQTSAEGWLLPDTYAFVRGTTDVALLKRAYAAMRSELQATWDGRDEALPYQDPYELLIAASLVEKETGHPDDRDKVSAVFASRLRIGMRLQTDPTIIYGLGDAFDGNLTRAHLRADGPYNTYRNHGLTPTPIAMPGLASLHAAAHPADVDYLYFVARGDGTSQFSRTLAEHEAAVRRYQLGR